MRERVAAAVAAAAPGAAVAVALGGGADSAVLAWAAVESGRRVRALFVDHALPGSPLLHRSATELAARLAIPLTVLSGPVADGPDLESRCRDVRRERLLGALEPGEVLLLGHTKTDQAETVLLNLLRGAGARGLSAMALQTGDVARPLLAFTRAELAALAEELGLPAVADPANDDPRFLRNRLRSEVIPLLEDLRPGAVEGLARAASHLEADDRHLSALASAIGFDEADGVIRFPAEALAAEDEAIAARGVLAAMGSAVTAGDVAAVLAVARGEERRRQLTGARFVEREGNDVVVWAEEPPVPEPVRLEIPGSVEFGMHRIRAVHHDGSGPSSRNAQDLAVDTAELAVRAVAHGDRIDIGGGTKLVRDALMEASVPRRLRRAWPVVVVDGYIAAVPGVRVAAWARSSGAPGIRVTSERSAT